MLRSMSYNLLFMSMAVIASAQTALATPVATLAEPPGPAQPVAFGEPQTVLPPDRVAPPKDIASPHLGGGCTFTQGYWKTHNPLVCAETPSSPRCIEWPVTTLTLGNVEYDVEKLLSIFETPPGGNGLLTLAHQLLAAKLNIANAAAGSTIMNTIAEADVLINNLAIPPIGKSKLEPGLTSSLTTALANYNEGATGPGHCAS